MGREGRGEGTNCILLKRRDLVGGKEQRITQRLQKALNLLEPELHQFPYYEISVFCIKAEE
uniref:Uncharacterized protein n=1 Tax=Octopus bimaculoides TaxID=37653 RepID=A0A0L8FMU8_OCTBM